MIGGGIEDREILDRKKAWADLEREQTEVKRNIKSLMKFEPGSRVIDDPALASRVSNVRMNPQTYDTAEDAVFEKQMNENAGLGRKTASSPRDKNDGRSTSGDKKGSGNQYPS